MFVWADIKVIEPLMATKDLDVHCNLIYLLVYMSLVISLRKKMVKLLHQSICRARCCIHCAQWDLKNLHANAKLHTPTPAGTVKACYLSKSSVSGWDRPG